MPLMPGSSTSACSTTPMPLRTTRSEPSTPAPEQVTTCGRGGSGQRVGREGGHPLVWETCKLREAVGLAPCKQHKTVSGQPPSMPVAEAGQSARFHAHCHTPAPAPGAPGRPHRNPQWVPGSAGCPTPPQSSRAARGRAASCAACSREK
jgi:hypothetical protein